MGHLSRAWWELHHFCKTDATTWVITGSSSKEETTEMAGKKVSCQGSHGRCGVSGYFSIYIFPYSPIPNSLYLLFSYYFNFPKETWWIHLTFFTDLQDRSFLLVFWPFSSIISLLVVALLVCLWVEVSSGSSYSHILATPPYPLFFLCFLRKLIEIVLQQNEG